MANCSPCFYSLIQIAPATILVATQLGECKECEGIMGADYREKKLTPSCAVCYSILLKGKQTCLHGVPLIFGEPIEIDVDYESA